MVRSHGSAKRYHHDIVGYNYRMHGFQGAVLGVKLKYLKGWTDLAAVALPPNIASSSRAPISGCLTRKNTVRHVYHLFVIRVKDRAKVMTALTENGIESGIHYPVPLHLTPAYANLGYKKGAFPVTETAAEEILSLPMFPEMTSEQITRVASCLKKVCT